MTKWEALLGHPIAYAEWKQIWERAAKSSSCVTYRENTYKVLMFWYHTPQLLKHLSQDISDRCWRCMVGEGTHLHIFWECPVIVPFWRMVESVFFQLLAIRFPFTPFFYLLNMPKISLKKQFLLLVLQVLTAARRLIARFWLRADAPTRLDLIDSVREVRKMEYLTACITNTVDRFTKIWQTWDDVFNHLQ